MKRKAIGGGVYKSEDGRFWSRPWVNRGRTWKLLEADTRKAAFKEAAVTEWDSETGSFAELSRLYIDAGCPNRRLESRDKEFCKPEKTRIESLDKFFGPMAAADIRLANIPAYARWRMRQAGRGTKQRAVDKDTQTLSNVLNYGVGIGHLEINYIRSGRPRYRKSADVRHCRERAPRTADAIHAIAEELFQSVDSEVLAWQLLFSEMTGCRTSELLRLRKDARTPDDPGFVQADRLFLGRRSKGGINPWAIVGAEFSQMLECFDNWHRTRFPKSKWYFPGRIGNQPVNSGSLGHALTRICKHLKIDRITPHGVRSFYVTKRRSDGASDVQIAGEIGDKTVVLMQTTYGNRPDSWSGGKLLSWIPSEGLPSWLRWKRAQSKIIKLTGMKP